MEIDGKIFVDIRDSLRGIEGHLARIAESLEQSPVMRVQKVTKSHDIDPGFYDRSHERPDSERPDFQHERSDSDFTIRVGDSAIVRKAHGNWDKDDVVMIAAIQDDDIVIASGVSGVEHNYITDEINPTLLQKQESRNDANSDRIIGESERGSDESSGESGIQGTGD